ncbi:MAG: hypothetical protein AAF653_05370 [Chloroflexota bacterium]
MRRILPGFFTLVALLMLAALAAAVPPVPHQGPVVPTRQPTPSDAPPPPPGNEDNAINVVFPFEEDALIEVGDVYEGVIENDEQYAVAVQFEGRPGQSVNIITDALDNDLEPFLISLDPNSREIARSTDLPRDETDAALYSVPIPDDGIYTVIITRDRSYYGDTEGEFMLAIEEANRENDLEPPLIPVPARYDAELNGEFNTDRDTTTYTFRGEVGEVVNITASPLTEDLIAEVILTDNAGNEIYFNDSVNPLFERDAAIIGYPLPYTGHYTIVVHDAEATGGQYVLFLERDERLTSEEHRILTIAPMDADQSQTVHERNNGFVPVGFFIGDHFNEDLDQDLRVQAVLTFHIPPTTPPIREAILDLSTCNEAGGGFDTIESYQVYLDNGIDTVRENMPFRPSPDDELVGRSDDCTGIDITAPVRDYYNDDETRIRFRILAQSVQANGETDALVFPDPRLILIHEPR